MAKYTLTLDTVEIKTLQDILEQVFTDLHEYGLVDHAVDSIKTKVVLAQLPDEPTEMEAAYTHDTRHPGADSADGPAF